MARMTFGLKMCGSLMVSALAISGVQATAAPIVQHTGANDPTTEGFTYGTNGASVVTSGVTNDNGTGLDAWIVDDNGANFGLYYKGFSAAERTSLLASNFTGTMRLRVPDISTSPAGAVLFDVNLGPTNRRFLIYFGTNANGELTIAYNDGSALQTIAGASNQAYHTVRLDYDFANADADVFVDNTLAKANYTGFTSGGSNQNGNANGQVQFGSGSGAGQGQGNYNLVSVAIPEPASLALLGLGGLLMLGRRRKA